jgi:hypothetical protein
MVKRVRWSRRMNAGSKPQKTVESIPNDRGLVHGDWRASTRRRVTGAHWIALNALRSTREWLELTSPLRRGSRKCVCDISDTFGG